MKERALRLRLKGEAALAGHLSVQVGRTIEVVIERDGFGRAPDFSEVVLERTQAGARTVALAHVEGHDGRRLMGRIAA